MLTLAMMQYGMLFLTYSDMHNVIREAAHFWSDAEYATEEEAAEADAIARQRDAAVGEVRKSSGNRRPRRINIGHKISYGRKHAVRAHPTGICICRPIRSDWLVRSGPKAQSQMLHLCENQRAKFGQFRCKGPSSERRARPKADIQNVQAEYRRIQ